MFALALPYRWLIGAGFLIGVLGCGFWLGWRASDARSEPKIAAAETNLATMGAAMNVLKAASATQNAAVMTLATQSEVREEAVRSAVKRGEAANKPFQAKAATVMREMPPAHVDTCVAARNEFDDELRRERAK